MKNRSSYAVLTRFGIIAAILATLVLIAPAATAQSECELDGSTVKCTYVENGEEPVATFSAMDDEGDTVTWSLKEVDDYKKFTISESGVIEFASPPNFDSPGDADGDNVYKVTVVAGAGDRAHGERAVEITVTDVNEPGTVSFTGNQQPQVDATMTAKLDDEDGQTVRLSWQWSKSEGMDGPWENVASTTASYTPKEADVGSYLRATVSYTDVEYDEADEVSGVTTYKVRARPASNAAPKFEAQTIEVFENTDGGIGTVTASDDDVLLYRLWETGDPAVDSDADGDTTVDSADNDNARFKISDTGDLSLVGKLDFEQADTDTDSETDIDGTADIDGDGTNDNTVNIVEHTVVVTAIDPSGAKGSGVVKVHLLNVDEAPSVTVRSGATENEATVVEAGTQPGETARMGQITAIAFTAAADPEGKAVNTGNTDTGGPDSSNTLRWTLEGPDAEKFDFDSTTPTQILFKGATSDDDGFFRPNFEDKKDANGDNVYEVTVVVPVADSVKPGKRAVKVKVADAEDTGKLTIAAREPQVGATVSGTLTDEDGGVRDRVWQWYRGGTNATTDGEMTTLVGTITAADATTRPANCSATNAPSQTVACKIDKATAPSYTTTSADGGYYVHLVVDYTDAFQSGTDGATDTATLAQKPTRAVQSPPTQNAAPKFGIQDREIDGDDAAPESVTRNIDENTKAIADFKSTDTDLLTFKLGGADEGLFKVSDPSGDDNEVSLSFADAPNYESPADADEDNSYEVSIIATDPSGATDTLMVTVVVGGVDDKPVVSFAGDEMCEKGGTVKCTYAENGEGSVATFSVADDENDPTTWTLKEADDYKKFEISADGVLTFKSSPDFDSAGDGDDDNVYKVTVVADAGDRADGEKAVEVTVTDLDEPGTVTFLGNQQPQVGELMTAQLKDQDGNTVRLSWQWSKSESMDGPWEDVSSTNASYRAQDADVGSYLRATVSYTDVEYDEADEVSGVTKFTVRARPSANAAPTIPAQSIEVFENVDGTIGSITAKDDDVLIFAKATGTELEITTAGTADANDNDRFTVTDSGELKLVDKLNFEQPSGDALNSNTNVTPATGDDEIIEYTAIVKATDPSGASGVGKVIVHLLDVDEAPEVTSSATDNAATVSERGFDTIENGLDALTGQITAITFTVATDADPEGGAINTTNTATGGPDSSDTLRWELEGADAERFALDGTSLTFKGADADDDKFRPNYEKPADADKDNVYEVTVVVPVNGSNLPGKRSVKITVENAEDRGSLKIEARQPQVGATVSGKLTDEDGGIRDREWQWYRGVVADGDIALSTLAALTDADNCSATNPPATGDPCKIDKAESSSYVTTSADGGHLIHLKVSYTDAHDNTAADGTDTMTLVARPVRAVQTPPTENEAPKFGIQDREIDGDDQAPEHVMRMVKEGNKPVADFSASDGDDDLFTFKLGSDDEGMFSLSGPSGEENSVSLSFKDAPDYESPGDADGDNSYEVSITATDPSGATDTLMVTVMVEDVDDAPTLSLVSGPAPDPAGPDCMTAAEGAPALAADCQVLLNAMDELIGEDGTATLNWSVDTLMKDWNGVSRLPGRVIGIHLAGGSDNLGGGVLAGTIPASFNELDALERLTLRDNELTGGIPDLSNLDSLTHLILDGNMLTGSVPDLGEMDSVDYVYLHDNNLSGSIPAGVGDATTLRRLHLHQNDLDGDIPSELGNLTRLRYLILSGNDLDGDIPSELAGAMNLKLLYLDGNMLTGSIPAELGSIVDANGGTLKRLYLNDNMLMGDIPSELGDLDLSILRLSGNMLSGCIPASIFDVTEDAADAGLMACEAEDES